ncbi:MULTISPECIES: 30S ribosomal protein S20 [Acidithiobacillus]|uniref:Small ribosomal subunit protein bS20 n=3 Tax=Acidithiobacillus caldus TaxID=33059 RepID=F9ZLW9_ACICS|nr:MULTISPECIES: 30S ribosomal protein S20 [Acidithiobacillus]AEK57451.1 SSU ribosomal protein S20p [Acidithiobacillus caldus SM-1]AIA54661.1 SSU ribosomal protein S20p [Acidithiobacillus caldus ATCC 51756]AUW32166.1 30S ribosomal protein S20 [Acidithiobacillus caldus]MBU2729278.1 30S ribosomal protein S20 [Acidithiobacillus caldus]MBU2737162.1 30S ribosomal protein S20 [Acidithiobacillus caldus ATCC 51756]
MANSAQARKRVLQNENRRRHNASLRSRMRTYVKSVLKAVREGDQEQARRALHQAESIIDKTASKGIVHANTAARTKSRLSARVKALGTAQS